MNQESLGLRRPSGVTLCDGGTVLAVCGGRGFGRERERGERERKKTGYVPFSLHAPPCTKLCCGYVIKSHCDTVLAVCGGRGSVRTSRC